MGKKDKIIHPKVKGTEMVFRSISLPASLVEDLKLLKESFEKVWYKGGEKERVTYEKIFERLLSKSVLGRVESDVYKEFIAAKETRKEFPAVVTRATRGAVGGIFKRMQGNGTSLMEEALKEQEEAEASLKKDLAAAAGDSTAPAEDQGRSPEPLDMAIPEEVKRRWKEAYWFIDPEGHKVKAVIKTVQGLRAFFPEDASSWGKNYRTLMNQYGWVMTDNQGNELQFAEAQEIVKEFEADHRS